MEEKIKLAGKYDIQDHKLIRAKTKKPLKATIRYSEEMGTIYFRFENAESYAITNAVDVTPDFSLPLEQAKDSFRDAVVEALTESTWEGDCPLMELDRKFLIGTAEWFADKVFRKRAIEEIEYCC